jgi:hypothetical protein
MKIAMKCVVVAACTLLGLNSTPAFSATGAQWTFETSAPITAGPVGAEVGAGSASGLHAGAATYSSPVGNGSLHSFSANTWAVSDYWQFQVSTVGYTGVSLSWDQTASNTGPRDFQLKYSTDGVNFTNFGSVYSVLANAAPNAVWNSTTGSAIYNFFYDLSTISALDNQATAYFRLVDASTISANGATVAAAGTNRVDNVTISAAPASVPVPAAVWLLGSGIATLAGFGRRRKSA